MNDGQSVFQTASNVSLCARIENSLVVRFGLHIVLRCILSKDRTFCPHLSKTRVCKVISNLTHEILDNVEPPKSQEYRSTFITVRPLYFLGLAVQLLVQSDDCGLTRMYNVGNPQAPHHDCPQCVVLMGRGVEERQIPDCAELVFVLCCNLIESGPRWHIVTVRAMDATENPSHISGRSFIRHLIIWGKHRLIQDGCEFRIFSRRLASDFLQTMKLGRDLQGP